MQNITSPPLLSRYHKWNIEWERRSENVSGDIERERTTRKQIISTIDVTNGVAAVWIYSALSYSANLSVSTQPYSAHLGDTVDLALLSTTLLHSNHYIPWSHGQGRKKKKQGGRIRKNRKQQRRRRRRRTRRKIRKRRNEEKKEEE